jgi:hypothetical protein
VTVSFEGISWKRTSASTTRPLLASADMAVLYMVVFGWMPKLRARSKMPNAYDNDSTTLHTHASLRLDAETQKALLTDFAKKVFTD